MKAQRWTIDRWTVDYGDGHREPVTVPHAWKQDMDVRDEGPVVYRVRLSLPPQPAFIRFNGVSYAAEVRIDGELRATHEGIWDAFEVPVQDLAGKQVEVEVSVVKNGGKTYPVKSVASGFLPYVHSTFGGIFREVQLVLEGAPPQLGGEPQTVAVVGREIHIDGEPFYMRGLLHWGWYPELGHPNPSEDTIRKEVREAKRLGFNTVKFCLWLPPHRYLEILRQEDMQAWIELPVWLPSERPADQTQMWRECEAIVRQYRHHENILAWSIGCELGAAVPAATRQRLCQMVRNLTGCTLVGDSSGGSEMYGGELAEFGDFYDPHPYCDLPFYPLVLDSLLPGPRTSEPMLLGEFNDIDVHRDLAHIHDQMPYWASTMTELNDQGVRWQHDLPRLAHSSRFVGDHASSEALMRSSIGKAAFIRKTVQEAVRARGEIGGYVITGWRDTPISTAGFFDDWGVSRFSEDEVLRWNSPECLFMIPARRPPWHVGGNRPGWVDPLNAFAGPQLWRIGLHSEHGTTAGLVWRILDSLGEIVAEGAEPTSSVGPCESLELGTIAWNATASGDYVLEVEAGSAANRWTICVVAPLVKELSGWKIEDTRGLFSELMGDESGSRMVADAPNELSGSGIAFLLDEGTWAGPFWREAAYEFHDSAFWSEVPFREAWPKLLPISCDRFIDAEWLKGVIPSGAEVQVLMNRVDTRTYREDPVLVRVVVPDGGTWLITTLRPFGGLGSQPTSLAANPAGVLLLRSLTTAVGAMVKPRKVEAN